MNETETARYHRLLPKLAELAGLKVVREYEIEQPHEKGIITRYPEGGDAPFMPLNHDGDCFKLLCGLCDIDGHQFIPAATLGGNPCVQWKRKDGYLLMCYHGDTWREAWVLAAMDYVECIVLGYNYKNPDLYGKGHYAMARVPMGRIVSAPLTAGCPLEIEAKEAYSAMREALGEQGNTSTDRGGEPLSGG